MVWFARPAASVGVPLIAPVKGSSLSPAGSGGDTLKPVAGPPSTKGTIGTPARPRVRTAGFAEYPASNGAVTDNRTTADEAGCPVKEAVMV